jgi:3-hydroxypropanoate dehydrogenase
MHVAEARARGVGRPAGAMGLHLVRAGARHGGTAILAISGRRLPSAGLRGRPQNSARGVRFSSTLRGAHPGPILAWGPTELLAKAHAPMLDDTALDTLFRKARSHNRWLPKPIDPALLERLYALMSLGPTSANCMPARLLFLTTPDAKERLRPALSKGNLEKTMNAPVTVVVAQDEAFHEQLPKLFPHADARAWFTGNPAFAHETALRNASLQGAYLMMAARALGLDCGPMSGFDAKLVNATLLEGTGWTANFLCNLGYGDPAGLFPRLPRLSFAEACRIL